ncbi:MAG: hypothetical protein HYV09_31585 [Deltaproteobacteria bacterium]|nr:hypothetical protein [Deltaproteobacteria bacterium]
MRDRDKENTRRRVAEALRKALSANRWRPPRNDSPVETPTFDPPGPMHQSMPSGLPLPERPSSEP